MSARTDESGSSSSAKRSRKSSRPSWPSGSTTTTARWTTSDSVTGSGSVGMGEVLPLAPCDRTGQLVLRHGRPARDVELLRARVEVLLRRGRLLGGRRLHHAAHGLG